MTLSIYALGLGCERGCEPQELLELARKVLEEAGIGAADLTAAYSIDLRRGEPALAYVSQQLDVSVSYFSAAVLEEQTLRLLNPSERVFALTGCHGVAEAAALAAVGSDGVLVIGKTKSAHATAALAVKG